MQGEKSECRLTVTDVVSIREMVGAGMPQGKIAGVFGVARSTVASINSGRTWKGVLKFKVKKQVDMRLGQGGCGKCGGWVGTDYACDLESEPGRFLMREEFVCINCGSRRETGKTRKYLKLLTFS